MNSKSRPFKCQLFHSSSKFSESTDIDFFSVLIIIIFQVPPASFFDAKTAPKSLASGASPQTPLGELTTVPRPSSRLTRGLAPSQTTLFPWCRWLPNPPAIGARLLCPLQCLARVDTTVPLIVVHTVVFTGYRCTVSF